MQIVPILTVSKEIFDLYNLMYPIGSFECTCKTGYVGDGQFCADENECLTGTNQCDPLADCTNTDASYTCTCPTVSSEIISFYPFPQRFFNFLRNLFGFRATSLAATLRAKLVLSKMNVLMVQMTVTRTRLV